METGLMDEHTFEQGEAILLVMDLAYQYEVPSHLKPWEPVIEEAIDAGDDWLVIVGVVGGPILYKRSVLRGEESEALDEAFEWKEEHQAKSGREVALVFLFTPETLIESSKCPATNAVADNIEAYLAMRRFLDEVK